VGIKKTSRRYVSLLYPRPMVGALSDDGRLMSVGLSVADIRPKSRTERPRKTKIDREVAHVTRDSDTTFEVKKSKINLQGAETYCGGLPHSSFRNIYIWPRPRSRPRGSGLGLGVLASFNITAWGGECFFRVHRHPSSGAGIQRSPILGDSPYLCLHPWT